jgi:hypothetical protein
VVWRDVTGRDEQEKEEQAAREQIRLINEKKLEAKRLDQEAAAKAAKIQVCVRAGVRVRTYVHACVRLSV